MKRKPDHARIAKILGSEPDPTATEFKGIPLAPLLKQEEDYDHTGPYGEVPCPKCKRETMTDEERNKCFREGEDANDHNRRLYRKKSKGLARDNPYAIKSEAWKAWNDGYGYRDMVNDG